jgi:hypothetical protein
MTPSPPPSRRPPGSSWPWPAFTPPAAAPSAPSSSPTPTRAAAACSWAASPPLDDLTARLLRTWLQARRGRWPGTANPHLLINAQTALGTGPASRTWVNSALRGHAATIEALRVDRQLEEAMATGADPLHLAATFGLDPGTAVRYASSARQLLQTAAEQQDPAGIPPEPKDRIRARRLKTPQLPPATPHSG